MTPNPDEMRKKKKKKAFPCHYFPIMPTNPREESLLVTRFEGLEKTNAWGH